MKLRIAITRREYMTTLDGVNRFVFTLADGLSALGHEVHVVSYSFRDTSCSELDAYVKSFFDVERDIKVHVLTKGPEAEIWSKIALMWFWKGSKLLNQLDVDAVIINGIVPLRIAAPKIAVNHGIHGVLASAKGFKKHVYLQSAKYLYRHCTSLPVCVSLKLGRELKKFMGIDCMVVPLPIKLHLFKAESVHQRDPLIVHIGARPWKNVELSIRSVKMLVEKMNVNVKLVVAGSKNTYVEKLASKYKHIIPRHLDFIFNAENSRLRDLLAYARVLILPSRYESFSYVVLEAFASGLPVVVSEAVPKEVVLDGYNGFRVHGFKPSQYATRLASLLKDDSLWRDISGNALKTANDYSHIKIARNYEHVISRLIEARR